MSRRRLRISPYATGGLAVVVAGGAIFLLIHARTAPRLPAIHEQQAAFLARHARDPRVQPCTRMLLVARMSARKGGSGSWVLGGTTYTDAQVTELVSCMRKRLAGKLARPGQAELLRSTARTE